MHSPMRRIIGSALVLGLFGQPAWGATLRILSQQGSIETSYSACGFRRDDRRDVPDVGDFCDSLSADLVAACASVHVEARQTSTIAPNTIETHGFLCSILSPAPLFFGGEVRGKSALQIHFAIDGITSPTTLSVHARSSLYSFQQGHIVVELVNPLGQVQSFAAWPG